MGKIYINEQRVFGKLSNSLISPLSTGGTNVIKTSGVPVVAQWLTNPTRNHEVEGSVPALAQWVRDPALPRDVV